MPPSRVELPLRVAVVSSTLVAAEVVAIFAETISVNRALVIAVHAVAFTVAAVPATDDCIVCRWVVSPVKFAVARLIYSFAVIVIVWVVPEASDSLLAVQFPEVVWAVPLRLMLL